MVVRTVLALIVGSALGAGGAWVATPGPAADDAPPCSQALAAAKGRTQTLERELQGLSAEFDQRWRDRVAALGQQVVWPDDVPDALQPDAIRTHVQQVMDDKGGELLALDCNAYPCVAIVRWPVEPEEMEIVASGADGALFPGSMMADLNAHPDYDGRPMVDVGAVDGDGASIHAFAWYDAEDIRKAKAEAADQVEIDGDRIDRIRGRNAAVFDSWQSREQP